MKNLILTLGVLILVSVPLLSKTPNTQPEIISEEKTEVDEVGDLIVLLEEAYSSGNEEEISKLLQTISQYNIVIEETAEDNKTDDNSDLEENDLDKVWEMVAEESKKSHKPNRGPKITVKQIRIGGKKSEKVNASQINSATIKIITTPGGLISTKSQAPNKKGEIKHSIDERFHEGMRRRNLKFSLPSKYSRIDIEIFNLTPKTIGVWVLIGK